MRSHLSSTHSQVYKTVSSSNPEISPSANNRDDNVTDTQTIEPSSRVPDTTTLNIDTLTLTETGTSSDNDDGFGISSISDGSTFSDRLELEKSETEMGSNQAFSH